MASVPYDQGVPDTSPQTSVGDDYQHVNASPSSFGGAIAQGVDQLGAGASKAGQFYGQVAADDGQNKLQSFTQKLMYGDPNKQVQRSDGTMGPDTGYLGLKGADAMNARPGVEAQLDAQEKLIRGNLSTPESQLQFDNFSKRLRSGTSSAIGSHSETQSTAWYQSVNADSASLALQRAVTNAGNPEAFAAGSADYINARVKTAQLAGAKQGDPVWTDTIARAKQDMLKAQVQEVSVKDPAAAQRILENHKDIAGTEYEPLASALRSRADQAIGYASIDGKNGQPGIIAQAHAGSGYANPSLPAFAQAAAEGGMSPAGMARVVQIESSGNPNAGRGTSHVGLVQAGSSYWSRYGQGSPFDPQQAIAALGRSTASDRSFLQSKLGRPPTDAELYVAHQQGAGGAEKLLLFPNARAGDLVGDKQVRSNGGNPDGTAAQFVNLWAAKFNGTTPHAFAGGGQVMTMPASVSGATPATAAAAAPATPAADAPLPTFAQAPAAQGDGQPAPPAPPAPIAPPAPTPDATTRSVENIPSSVSVKADVFSKINEMEQAGFATINGERVPFSHEAAQHARSHAAQQLQAESIASEQDTRARKAMSDQAADGYIKRALAGDFNGLLPAIINDPHLTWETRRSIGEAVEKESSDGSRETIKHNGPGFYDALMKVTAPADDPSRINDPAALYRRVGRNGDLTLTGAEKLASIVNQVRHSVDDANAHTALHGMLAYGTKQLSFDQEMSFPGAPPFRDPIGARVAPMFASQYLSSYDTWVKAGKDPWAFLKDRKIVDDMVRGLRSPREMAQARLSAGATADPSPALGSPQAPQAPQALAAAPSDGFLPPPPRGVDQNSWVNVVSRPPPSPRTGEPLPFSFWGKQINILMADPSPRNIQYFNQTFGHAGFDGAKIVSMLQGQPEIEPPKPPAPPPEKSLGNVANQLRAMNEWLGDGQAQAPAPVQPQPASQERDLGRTGNALRGVNRWLDGK